MSWYTYKTLTHNEIMLYKLKQLFIVLLINKRLDLFNISFQNPVSCFLPCCFFSSDGISSLDLRRLIGITYFATSALFSFFPGFNGDSCSESGRSYVLQVLW